LKFHVVKLAEVFGEAFLPTVVFFRCLRQAQAPEKDDGNNSPVAEAEPVEATATQSPHAEPEPVEATATQSSRAEAELLHSFYESKPLQPSLFNNPHSANKLTAD
jgi:hypothetical protein